MDKDTFNTIRRALHPDSRNSISDKKLAEAFHTFRLPVDGFYRMRACACDTASQLCVRTVLCSSAF